MPKLVKKRSKKAGLAPGTLVHIGEHRPEQAIITVTLYGPEQTTEHQFTDTHAFPHQIPAGQVAWVNVDGINQLEVIERIGAEQQLHALTLEDIVNTDQRPKIEDYGSYLYIVLKTLSRSTAGDALVAEQVSLIVKPELVISFQEKEGDLFQTVRERLRNPAGRLRKLAGDYLAYALLDAIVDNYFVILEQLGETIEEMQECLLTRPQSKNVEEIHALRREMIFLRRVVWPLREILTTLERVESPLLQSSTRLYLKDVYDHVIHVMDTIEVFREMLAAIFDIYLSSISLKMNQVMKVLTVIATIFIPLTFIAGVYGMNFRYMPELDARWGYPAVLVLMAAIGVCMLAAFRRKGWI